MNGITAAPESPESSDLRTGLPLLAAMALWAPLLGRLSHSWRIEPDQAYGWAVPLLVLYLVRERARTCPENREPSAAGRRTARLILAAALVALCPLLAVLEANPLWPSAQWSGTGAVVAATLAGLTLLGGQRWAAHFSFPVAFVFTALIWPGMVKQGVFGLLAPVNAAFAAECVSAMGHPAVATANVVEVAGGVVGVDEACSGLRSLQAAVMLGLFFGEFYRLGLARRIGMVMAALGLAMAGNFARTTFLAWQAAVHGLAATERWHDTAGGVALLLTLAGTAGLAAWLAHGRRVLQSPAVCHPVTVRGKTAVLLTILTSGVLAESLVQGWYGWRDHMDGVGKVRWTLTAEAAGWSPATLPKASLALLHCSKIEGLAHGRYPATADALAYVLRWEGDVALTGEWHDPTVCLPNAGVTLSGELPPLTLVIEGVTVRFAHYRFANGDLPQHVFFVRWDEHHGRSVEVDHTLMENVTGYRLQRVRDGRRRADVEQITFVVGAANDGAASEWGQTAIPQLLRRAK